ncbi:chaperone [Coemansia sp. Benny D115]|nr:chaperone [Coemansia sp. Benny D115]
MVVQYLAADGARRTGKNGKLEPNHFGDVMSQRETSCMLPAVFKNPVQRIMLMANGNLQRVLSAYYNMPVSVEVLFNEPVAVPDNASNGSQPRDGRLPVRFRRVINLVCNRTVVCTAESDVDLLTSKAVDLVISQGVGIGQLFRYMNILPTFSLREARLSDHDGSFERQYVLCCDDVVCSITERFPDGMLDPEFCSRSKTCPSETLTKNKTPGIKRFWRKVGVAEKPGGLAVELDGRAIKTPDGRPVLIPSKQPMLAWLVAGEWESQSEYLGAHSLPLTSLVCRAIDGLGDQSVRSDVIEKLLKYFQTDSACLHEEFPQALVDLQTEHYMPVVEWAREKYGVPIAVTCNLFALRQSPEAVDCMRKTVSQFSPLKLAAFERAVMSAKSFLIALALVEQRITAEQAARASQVEASSQTQLWGELENAHDIDNAAIRQILGASGCAAVGA